MAIRSAGGGLLRCFSPSQPLQRRPTRPLCTAAATSGGPLAAEGDAGSSNISRVFVVFSNHLEVGYTDSSAAGVVQDYWDKFSPAAIATANEFRQKQPTVRFRWMCHSWIVSMFRHCSSSVINVNGSGQPLELTCPSAAALAAFEQGARAGDIGWHAFPFNAEPEVYDRSLFLAALNLTHAEDEYYNHSRRITYSQRDVPGLT